MLKRLFELGTTYSGQILSYIKILGQITDAGNTTTLAHYLHLLNEAGLLGGLEKYSPNKLRQRASSPKFFVHNTAILSGYSPHHFSALRADFESWGRWVEPSIGAYLQNLVFKHSDLQLFYWREGNYEVD
jgi:predicted AAA+ superfamily ATPase